MPYDALGARSNRTRVLFVSSEIFPLAKTGGLADVSGALPRVMAEAGDIDVVLMLPGYPCALEKLEAPLTVARLEDLPGGAATLILGTLPGSDLPVLVLHQPALFDRVGLYSDDSGNDWPDNAVRFAALCHAAVRVAMGEILPHWRADIVHCNDWHTALIPALIVARGKPRPNTILTIHNLAFQGIFPLEALADLNLPHTAQMLESIEFYGRLSFLKSGLVHADRVTTVSPSYAEEIVGPAFGMGLDGVLAQRPEPLVGILNGIDQVIWNPAHDPLIPTNYSRQDLAGKDQCKAMLQREWGLDVDPSATLIVFLARLELQKMADILIDILPNLMERPRVQVAVLGTGSPEIQDAIAVWPSIAPGRVAVRIAYSEELAHRLLAAGDILLHGSRFEPCGLTPLYALRYGTIPIVNMVGGLRDTTIGANPETLRDRSANAIHFHEPSSDAMLNAVDTALALRDTPETWHEMRLAAMAVDSSWSKAATSYQRLYRSLALSERPPRG